MKVLSWNLYNLYDVADYVSEGMIAREREAEYYTETRNNYYISELQKISPDICFFYEVKSMRNLRTIAEGLYGNEYEVFTTTPDRRGIYNAVIYKKELQGKCSTEELFVEHLEIPLFEIDETPLTNKYLVQKRGHIAFSFDEYVIYGVHLKSQLPSNIKQKDGEDYAITNSKSAAHAQILGELVALAEGYALRKKLTEEIEKGKKVIVLGDYNSESRSCRYKVLQGLYSADDYMQSLFSEYDTTVDNSYVYKKNKIRLDHVLLSKEAFPKIKNPIMHSELIHEPREYTWHDTTIVGSDHAAVEFEIEQ